MLALESPFAGDVTIDLEFLTGGPTMVSSPKIPRISLQK